MRNEMNDNETRGLMHHFRKELGQNTAEYMLLLLLIGGGSIIAFKTFGQGIINRFASVTNVIGGNKAISATEVKGDEKITFETFDGEGKK
jgi:hypothetical protein